MDLLRFGLPRQHYLDPFSRSRCASNSECFENEILFLQGDLSIFERTFPRSSPP